MTSGSFLFVYGTLRQTINHPMHRVLREHGQLMGTGSFIGKLYNLGRFPGVVPSARKTDRVVGEVYKIRDEQKMFALLDAYEGQQFRRERRQVILKDRQKLSAWIYLYIGRLDSAEVVRAGDYVAFLHHPPRGLQRRSDVDRSSAKPR